MFRKISGVVLVILFLSGCGEGGVINFNGFKYQFQDPENRFFLAEEGFSHYECVQGCEGVCDFQFVNIHENQDSVYVDWFNRLIAPLDNGQSSLISAYESCELVFDDQGRVDLDCEFLDICRTGYFCEVDRNWYEPGTTIECQTAIFQKIVE